MRSYRIVLAAFAIGMGLSAAVDAQVLFFSRSTSFEHSCIRENDGEDSHVCKILSDLAENNGGILDCTKDGGDINADNLSNYSLVIFVTQGDLTKSPSRADHPAVTQEGLDELLEWVKGGGAFMGFHCASDTHRGSDGDPATPYIEMVGASFKGHGGQFEGTVKVVDQDHATMANIPDGWKIKDEWYVFANMNKENMHVLALMDPGEEGKKQPMYDIDPYPIAWCSKYGDGRVFYNAMGHREDVWSTEIFQKAIVDAAMWCMGEGEEDAEPNYAEVMGDK